MRYICSIVAAFDQQLFAAALVADCDWTLNLCVGQILFGRRYQWKIQTIGAESEEMQTWLWAWANTESNIPAYLLAASFAFKAYGEQNGIPELTAPQLPLDQIDGNTIALLTSCICEANAYYRCPYEGGALYVLIMDENFPKCQDPPLQRIATVFPQAISALDIPDHKLALVGYLDHYGLMYEPDGDKLVVKESGEVVLTATFDELNRLTNLEVKLNAKTNNPAESNPAESWDEGQLRRMLGG